MTTDVSPQRDFMIGLVRRYGHDKERVCREYAEAERVGLVPRKSNLKRRTAEQYANDLYDDGIRKRWITAAEGEE